MTHPDGPHPGPAPLPQAPPRARGRHSAESRMGIVSGILSMVLIIGLMQLWLLTATMNAYLGGDHAVAWPALGASVACLLLNLGLLRSLYRLEGTR